MLVFDKVYNMTTTCDVGPFTHHNHPPKPFNPLYDPRAKDWSTLATLDTINAGLYDETIPREAVAAYRLDAYHKRKDMGTPDPAEVKQAKQVIYDRG